MSKSHCRFCDITVQGIYINCPRCGKHLPPLSDAEVMPPPLPPEPFKLAEFGESWKFTDMSPEDVDKAMRALAIILPAAAELFASIAGFAGIYNDLPESVKREIARHSVEEKLK